MSVDKFGRFSKKGKLGPTGERGPRGLPGEQGPPGELGIQGPPGIGFYLTSDGDYNLNYKKIKNLGNPEENKDAINKKYVDEINNAIELRTSDLFNEIEYVKENLEKEVRSIYEVIERSEEKDEPKYTELIKKEIKNIHDRLKSESELHTSKSIDNLRDKLKSYVDKEFENIWININKLINVETITITKEELQSQHRNE